MSRQVVIVIYVVVMAAVIVGVDFAFLRGQFRLRLLVNAAIVLAFLVFYLIFLRSAYP